MVSAIVSGIIGLGGIVYQNRRADREVRGRLKATEIDETRRQTIDLITWLSIAKNSGGRDAAGPPPSVVSTTRGDLALIGDAKLIARYLQAAAWLMTLPDGGTLDAAAQAGLANLLGDIRRALAVQEASAIEGKPLLVVSEPASAALDAQATDILRQLAELQPPTSGATVVFEIHPADDDAFAQAVREATEADAGSMDTAVGRVGKRLQHRYPRLVLTLTARPDGLGPRVWKAFRDGRRA